VRRMGMHGRAHGSSSPGVANFIQQRLPPPPDVPGTARGTSQGRAYGYEAHPAESVPLADAMSAGLGECMHCFPENVPADAKPCRVLSDGTWVDGFLLEWRQGTDGRWKGLVNYRHEAGRRVALKDYPAELKRAGD